MQEFSRSFPMMLHRALNAAMPPLRAIFSAHGLTEPQWRVLRVLWGYQEIPFRDLAALTLVPAPSLVGIIDRLHTRGLCDRRRSATDRRNVYVLATASGRALEREVMPAVASAYHDLRANLDEATWQGLTRGLAAVAALSTRPNKESESESATW